ncbi:MAG: 3-oxo-5-alpha-steroid 4-dehydrogenase, partial [Rikenellaceae bacterium]|nr:3-oxo-5-alpha-steroid 4-dehydrogenase [Rikenellaceae bacterium]
MMTLDGFYTFLTVMTAIAAVVFIALFFVDAGYGKFLNPKFGPTIPNRIGWVLMECPVFIAMTIAWLLSERTWEVMPLVFFVIFQTHYFQRSFIFPMLIRGNGRIPISIMLMGATFNTLNALMQGGWIFHFGAMVNP